MPFDRGDRTYYVSDERLKAFKALSTEEKLRWAEALATFILLTRASGKHAAKAAQERQRNPWPD
jgi:hypothetical protein